MSKIQKLNQSEIDAIKALLSSFELPVSDLETAPVYFWGIKEKAELIATGALEIYGNNAIVRSVAVGNSFQKLGLGKQITLQLEKEAVEIGIKKLFLLTTTAESFFKKLNYISQDRESCPVDIKSSTQFRDLCPGTAICLSKELKG